MKEQVIVELRKVVVAANHNPVGGDEFYKFSQKVNDLYRNELDSFIAKEAKQAGIADIAEKLRALFNKGDSEGMSEGDVRDYIYGQPPRNVKPLGPKPVDEQLQLFNPDTLEPTYPTRQAPAPAQQSLFDPDTLKPTYPTKEPAKQPGRSWPGEDRIRQEQGPAAPFAPPSVGPARQRGRGPSAPQPTFNKDEANRRIKEIQTALQQFVDYVVQNKQNFSREYLEGVNEVIRYFNEASRPYVTEPAPEATTPAAPVQNPAAPPQTPPASEAPTQVAQPVKRPVKKKLPEAVTPPETPVVEEALAEAPAVEEAVVPPKVAPKPRTRKPRVPKPQEETPVVEPSKPLEEKIEESPEEAPVELPKPAQEPTRTKKPPRQETPSENPQELVTSIIDDLIDRGYISSKTYYEQPSRQRLYFLEKTIRELSDSNPDKASFMGDFKKLKNALLNRNQENKKNNPAPKVEEVADEDAVEQEAPISQETKNKILDLKDKIRAVVDAKTYSEIVGDIEKAIKKEKITDPSLQVKKYQDALKKLKVKPAQASYFAEPPVNMYVWGKSLTRDFR